MRVAQISPTFLSRASILGGAERFAVELSQSLARQVSTTLFTFSNANPRPTVESDGQLEIRTYPVSHYTRGNPANPLTATFLKDLGSFDCLHCHGYPNAITDLSILFARVTRKKLFVTDHHSGGVCASTYLSKLGVDTRRFINGFLLLSAHNAQQYKRYHSRTRVVGAGVDSAHFSPLEGVKKRCVLFAGRLISVKGIDYLIEAMDTETPLHVVGPAYDDSYFEHLKELARGKQVEFLTRASEGDLIHEYRSALVTVVPSVYQDCYGRVTSGELFGLVALESMACGTPVIATRCGGLPETIEDGVTGFLVPPNDPAALKEKIYYLLDRPAVARAMGEAGRKRVVGEFRWDGVAGRCLDAYAEALQR
jgi:alpha-maltose-1-phosphate synthase